VSAAEVGVRGSARTRMPLDFQKFPRTDGLARLPAGRPWRERREGLGEDSVGTDRSGTLPASRGV